MTKSSTDSALAQEMVGCIEAINSGAKSASAELILGLPHRVGVECRGAHNECIRTARARCTVLPRS